MQTYEVTILFKPNRNALDKTYTLFSSRNARFNDGGVKRLAYPITSNNREYQTAHYVEVDVDLTYEETLLLDSALLLIPSVLRYLIVKKDIHYE